MEAQYGFSPEIFELIEPHPTRKRDEDKVGIGYGGRVSFDPFNQKSSEWNVIRENNNSQKVPVGNSCVFLEKGIEFGNLNNGAGVIATLDKSFTLNDKHKNIPLSVTFSFAISVSHLDKTDMGSTSAILPGGLMLHYARNKNGEYEPFGKYYYIDPKGDGSNWVFMGDSEFSKGSNLHKVVMVFQEDNLKLWENEKLIFEQKITPYDDVKARFGLQYYGQNAGGHGVFNMINFQALVGLTQPYVSKTRAIPTPPSDSQKAKMKELAEYAKSNDLHGKASSIRDDLNKIPVGPSSLFWGIKPDKALTNKVENFKKSPAMAGFKNIIAPSSNSSNGKVGPALFIGIEADASFFLSIGYSIGFLFSLDGTNRSMAVLITSAGFETNVSADIGVGLGIFPNSTPESLKGFGVYTRVSFDTPIAGAGVGVNISGNYPMDTTNWSNCGPGVSLTASVSILPISLGAGVSWTFEMINLGVLR